jgi:hypothetical protein
METRNRTLVFPRGYLGGAMAIVPFNTNLSRIVVSKTIAHAAESHHGVTFLGPMSPIDASTRF